MRSAYKITNVFGIDIKMHVTFFLLLGLFFLVMGIRGVVLVMGVFFFVTVHELSHSLTARSLGVRVTKITLLPIGGVASMSKMPSKPLHELLISLAGPLSNLLVVLIFYIPVKLLIGGEALTYPLLVMIGRAEYAGPGSMNLLAHIYWINLVLAGFNMLPAFPMDGGRVLRALLSFRMGKKKATRIAVRMGHIFAILFGYFGIVYGHLLLVIIAVFIYMAASSEGMQVSFSETMKDYRVSHIVGGDFAYVDPSTPLRNVLEIMLHRHQENIPVMDGGEYVGLLTRREIMTALHARGEGEPCGELMRRDLPVADSSWGIEKVQAVLQEHSTPALAVQKGGRVVGVVTAEDINRLYVMVNAQEGNSGW